MVDSRRASVSLVATVLNEADSLPALLESITRQTRPPDEVVIADGGSTDATLAILQRWAEGDATRIVLHEAGATIARGRNIAIARASGEIVAVTDAGVILDPGWLERLAVALEARPDVGVASGFFVPDCRSVFERALAATTLPALADIDPAKFLPSSRSVALRRGAWESVGGYPEWLDYCEDLVFDLTLRDRGEDFAFVPGALVHFRPRPTLTRFFRQYYLYARGDGKADLWRRRHATRYAAYLTGVTLLLLGRRQPLWVGALLMGGGLYLRRPIQGLFRDYPSPQPSPARGEGTDGGWPAREGAISPSPSTGESWREAGLTGAALLRALALVPLIRFVGDVAKMLGYPVGVAWRLHERRLPLPLREGAGVVASVRRPITNPQPLTPNPELATPSCDLSIVIVSYNTRDLLRACLASVERSEGLARPETFVVDNASGDLSADMIAAEFPWVHLIRRDDNRGYANANNVALRKAHGRRVLLLNPDTGLSPTALADLMHYLDHHPEVGAVGPKLVRADGSLDLASRRSFPSPEVSFYRLTGLSRLFPGSRRFGRYNLTFLDPDVEADVDSVAGACMLVRREAIEQAGLLDERFFMYGEDLDWAFRMKEQGWRIRYNPKVVVLHHKGASSRQVSERATIAFYEAMRLFYEKHYRARTPAALHMVISGGILARLGWSLLKNRLRPSDQRQVST